MTQDGLRQATQKMTAAGVSPEAIEVFAYYYGELERGATGLIREDTIRPLLDPPALEDAEVDDSAAREALGKTAMIKLNGGLGTSMGMDKAKSLLPVRSGLSFLDIVIKQVLAARERYGVRLPLLLMNSFNTRDDTLEALARYPELTVEGIPADFLQSQEPKLLRDGLTPAVWPADPTLEWCPPGHGDLYPSLMSSGVLDALAEAGFRYICVSNSDNLGAAPNARLAGWFAASGAPYAAELCRRTAMDRKGGHLAVRARDGQLILRDTAQTAPEEMDFFTDEHRHPFFHTNNLWMNVQALQELLTRRRGVLRLPLIRNDKTVDPKDKSTPKVVQIETAMGAAIEIFTGAQAITVPRSRFLPVKTTNELLLLRSDVYDLGDDGQLTMAADVSPVISLDPAYYQKISDFEQRFPAGAPSLRNAESLTVKGDWTFEAGTSVVGEVTLVAEDGPSVAAGHLG